MSAPARPKPHVIADCHYEPNNGPSWTLCSCGKRFEAPTPAFLAVAYGKHAGRRPGQIGGMTTDELATVLAGKAA